MKCAYCLNETPFDECKKVFLREGRNNWQGPMFICLKCKDYLRGLFKYDKIKQKKGE
jgi:hypothetical protein